MNDKVLHVRLDADPHQRRSVVESLGSGLIPCERVAIELDANDMPSVTLRVPLIYVDLEVVGNEAQP